MICTNATSGGIVDADVDELPTDAMVTVEPRQEMRFPTEPTRPSFLIPMWISSVGFSAFIAPNWFGRLRSRLEPRAEIDHQWWRW